MARIKGKNGEILVGANVVAQVRSFTIDATGDTAEGTTMGMTPKEFEATQTAWTATADALVDVSDADGQGALLEGAELTVVFHPDGTGSGKPSRTGDVIVTGVAESEAHDGFAEVSYSFQGTGALDRTAQV